MLFFDIAKCGLTIINLQIDIAGRALIESCAEDLIHGRWLTSTVPVCFLHSSLLVSHGANFKKVTKERPAKCLKPLKDDAESNPSAGTPISGNFRAPPIVFDKTQTFIKTHMQGTELKLHSL